MEIFHNALYTKFIPSFRLKSDAEKEIQFQNYLKSIEEDYNDEEIQTKTEDGYFKTKYAVNNRKTIDGYNEKEVDMKRKKKKKGKFRQDFYKFQLKSLEDFSELKKKTREDDLHDALDFGSNLGEDDIEVGYLEKRKQRLKIAFQDDVRKMLKR